MFSKLPIIFRLAGLVILSLSSTLALSAEPTVIKYFSRNNSPGLWDYQYELLEVAMERTLEKYGAYSIEKNSQMFSAARGKLEAEKGRIINVHYSTSWSGPFIDSNNVVCLNYPIMHGLLGFRSLLIREADLAIFSNVDSGEKLKKLSAGQGNSWIDAEILESGGIKVVRADYFDILPPMLANKRFDFFPLSILEASAALDTISKETDGLSIAQDLYVFYPLAMRLCITKTEPQLIKRLQEGFALAANDGSIQQLFDKNFGFVKKLIENRKNTTFFINNPYISPDKNKVVLDAFTKNYGQYLSRIDLTKTDLKE